MLYRDDEFSVYVQSTVDVATSALLRDLATGLIEAVNGLNYGAGAPVTPVVKAIALEVAARAYRNPDGVQSRTRAIDDYSTTDRWDAVALGVFLTDSEIARLSRHAHLPVRTAWLGSRVC